MGGRIAAEHLVRYAFASSFVKNKKILDVASGEGYGSAIMAQTASSVIGVDIAEDAVIFAKHKYDLVKNVEFKVGDVTSLEFSAGSFDVITCFETIEHVDDPLEAIREISRVLTKNGLLIVSTPNKKKYSARYKYENPYHKKELEFDEFCNAFSNAFKNVSFYGQFSGAASNIVELKKNGSYFIPGEETIVTQADIPKWTNQASSGDAEPLYYIAVCSNTSWSTALGPMEFFDPGDERSIEDEFLAREIRSSSSLDTAIMNQLIFQIDIVNVLRNELKIANLKLEKSSNLYDPRYEAELKILRSAFNSLKLQYNKTSLTLRSIENSTTWRASRLFREVIGKSKILRFFFQILFSFLRKR